MDVDQAFAEIQRMIVTSHPWGVQECVKTVCKNFTAQDIKDLFQKVFDWGKWYLEEHDKRTNERYEEACLSARLRGLRGADDSAFSDFMSEQNDIIFRGLAEESERYEENIEAAKSALQNPKQEPDISAESFPCGTK